MKKYGIRIVGIALLSACLCNGLAAAAEPAPIESARMTYRENAVVLQGSNGINIENGTFEITDLRITEGQDPDGQNQAGQVHALQNGQFTFTVGRQGSASVATWFNEQFSGFNDPSVNGDRTTFDQTAEKLNFAFVGDLSLQVTTPSFPNGLSVTFPDVAFAQGSTAFRNNWWFGQRQGQHTRDGDGPDRLLTIGTDDSGKTVYASFLRGGNDVNAVSLEAIDIVEAASDLARKLPDVAGAFDALPVGGTLMELRGFPGNYDPSVNHIQGYAQYESAAGARYALLTHSVATSSYAHIIAGPKEGREQWGFKTYLKGWKHPGGIQTIGDYVLVPSEQSDRARISLYDLRALSVQELRRVETFDLPVAHKAGALGITSYTDTDGAEYYLLAVAHLDGANSVYHLYRAAADKGLEHASFAEVGSFAFAKDFQGFGLVTDANTNAVYLIGLWSPNEAASFADYAYLYQLDTQSWQIGPELAQHHLISTGGAAGMLGVHFRYGAGVFVSPDQSLVLSATERNTVLGSALATNDWMA